MLKLINPLKLNLGDKIAAVTLSWGGPGTFPYRFEVGKQRLEQQFGLSVIPSKLSAVMIRSDYCLLST